MRVRVLVVDESAGALREGLRLAGYEAAAVLSSPHALLKKVAEVQPDVIVIETDSPSRELLGHLAVVARPVIIFATDGAPETIREALRAGVTSFVVDGLDATRVKAIIDVAVARFEHLQRLRTELAEANLKLEERKLVERAKGVLMKTRGLDEDAAYQLLRRFAMDRKQKLAQVAQQLIDAADLLGA